MLRISLLQVLLLIKVARNESDVWVWPSLFSETISVFIYISQADNFFWRNSIQIEKEGAAQVPEK